jgi:hypothetical protein
VAVLPVVTVGRLDTKAWADGLQQKKNSRNTRENKGKMIMVFWWRIGWCFERLKVIFSWGFFGF